jgi:hypothetical protein
MTTKSWKRLPGSRTEPAGQERTVLRKLPMILLAGTAACVSISLLARLAWWGDKSEDTLRALQMIDICVIAAVVLHWTVVLTVGIFCFIVFVMKGPAYVADGYPLPDKNSPR